MKTKYSDEELKGFREIIIAKLEKAKADLEMLSGVLSNNDTNGTDDTSPTFKQLEEGNKSLLKEENGRLAARQEKFIIGLQNALIRIENGTYGICRATGKLIQKERLMAVPHATLSIEAKERANTGQSLNSSVRSLPEMSRRIDLRS